MQVLKENKKPSYTSFSDITKECHLIKQGRNSKRTCKTRVVETIHQRRKAKEISKIMRKTVLKIKTKQQDLNEFGAHQKEGFQMKHLHSQTEINLILPDLSLCIDILILLCFF